MIEIKNSFCGTLLLNKESGLPSTTKTDGKHHGIGLTSIQKIAQKYYGEIDIRQESERYSVVTEDGVGSNSNIILAFL